MKQTAENTLSQALRRIWVPARAWPEWAVKGGLAQAVLVQDLTCLSHDPAILMKILEFLQDHNAVLITTESDLQYELYIKGLEKHFLRRAAQKGLRLPW